MDNLMVNDYKVLAATLDLNEAITKLVEDNDKNIAIVLDLLQKYAQSLETAPLKEENQDV